MTRASYDFDTSPSHKTSSGSGLTPEERKRLGIVGLVGILIGNVYAILGAIVLPLCVIGNKCQRPFMAISAYPIWSGVFSIGGAYGWECYKRPKDSKQTAWLLVFSLASLVLSALSFSLAVYDSQWHADPSTEEVVKRAFSIVFAVFGVVEFFLTLTSSIAAGTSFSRSGNVRSTTM